MVYSDLAVTLITLKHGLKGLKKRAKKGIGNAWIYENLNDLSDVNKTVDLLNKRIYITREDFIERRRRIRSYIDNLMESGVIDGIVTIEDELFPEVNVENVPKSEMPLFLIYKGDIALLSRKYKRITVIGTVRPDKIAIDAEREIVKHLVLNEVVVVSGLALGCDEIAHEETLKRGGKTIAILPSSLKNIFPPQNKWLANRIIKSYGLIITEYLYDDVKPYMFVERDRLQALFTDGLVLISSYYKGKDKSNDSDYYAAPPAKYCNSDLDQGSRHATFKALRYGIPVAALYSSKEELKNNFKFNLNRFVLQLGKNKNASIVAIRLDNIKEDIEKFLSLKKKRNQKRLF